MNVYCISIVFFLSVKMLRFLTSNRKVNLVGIILKGQNENSQSFYKAPGKTKKSGDIIAKLTFEKIDFTFLV